MKIVLIPCALLLLASATHTFDANLTNLRHIVVSNDPTTQKLLSLILKDPTATYVNNFRIKQYDDRETNLQQQVIDIIKPIKNKNILYGIITEFTKHYDRDLYAWMIFTEKKALIKAINDNKELNPFHKQVALLRYKLELEQFIASQNNADSIKKKLPQEIPLYPLTEGCTDYSQELITLFEGKK